jgi:hypothetical protein
MRIWARPDDGIMSNVTISSVTPVAMTMINETCPIGTRNRWAFCDIIRSMRSDIRGSGKLLNPNDLKCPFIVYSGELLEVLGRDPHLEIVIATDAHEGPVYVLPANSLYFTSVPQNINAPSPGYRTVAINKTDFNVDPKTVVTAHRPSNMANDMTLDRPGRILNASEDYNGRSMRRRRMRRG